MHKNRSYCKNISKEKTCNHVFVVCVNLPMVKILGQSGEFPMSFSFLQCPLQMKKLIRENSAKNVNQRGNFYFRPNLKTAPFLCQYLMFFNDFIFTLEISFGSVL